MTPRASDPTGASRAVLCDGPRSRLRSRLPRTAPRSTGRRPRLPRLRLPGLRLPRLRGSPNPTPTDRSRRTGNPSSIPERAPSERGERSRSGRATIDPRRIPARAGMRVQQIIHENRPRRARGGFPRSPPRPRDRRGCGEPRGVATAEMVRALARDPHEETRRNRARSSRAREPRAAFRAVSTRECHTSHVRRAVATRRRPAHGTDRSHARGPGRGRRAVRVVRLPGRIREYRTARRRRLGRARTR